MAVTVVLGFICWIFIPNEFKNSALFHVGNSEYGTKTAALILLLIPLFALIPDKDNNEVHTDDPVERKKLLEEFAIKDAQRQVVIASFIGITVLAIMGFAALIL